LPRATHHAGQLGVDAASALPARAVLTGQGTAVLLLKKKPGLT
jgi:hypothetical protein